MKTSNLILTILFGILISSVLFVQPAAAQSVDSSVSVFVGQCNNYLPIISATLNVAGSTYSSNQLGYFSVGSLVPNQAYSGVLYATGYQPKTISLSLNTYGENSFNFCLTPSTPGYSSPVVFINLVNSNSNTLSNSYSLVAQSSSSNTQIVYTQISYSISNGVEQNFFCQSNICNVQLPLLQNGQTVTYYAIAVNSEGLTSSTSPLTYQVPSSNSNIYSAVSTLPPALSVYRYPQNQVLSPNTPVTLVASSQGQNSIISTEIFYQINNQPIQSQFCSSNYCSLTLNQLPASSTIYYWASSTDSNSLTTLSSKFDFQTSPVLTSSSNLTVHSFDCSTGNYLSGSVVTLRSATSNYVQITDNSANTVFSDIPADTYQISINHLGYSLSSLNYTLFSSTSSQVNLCLNSSFSNIGFPSVTIQRTPSGEIDYGQTVSFYANSSSSNGLVYTAISYSVDGQPAQTISCSSSFCSALVGPFLPGDIITYWAFAKQNGVSNLVGYSNSYSFKVGPFAQSQTSNSSGSSNSSNSSSLINSASCAVFSQLNSSDNFVSVAYYNYSQVPSYAQINCGNGQSFNSQCQLTSSNGSVNSGVCSSSSNYCGSYAFSQFYSISSTVGNIICSPVSFILQNNSFSSQNYDGSVSVLILDSSTYSPISLAQVSIDGLYSQTNSLGQATFSLTNGTYLLQSSANGYLTNFQNISITSNQSIQTEILLSPTSSINTCSLKAELASTSCNSGTENFTIRVQSNYSSPLYASVSMGSALPVNGPTLVYLPDSNGYYLNYSLTLPSSYSGLSNIQTLVSTNSSNCGSTNLQIPICQPGGISTSFVQQTVNGLPSTTVCTQAIVTNNGVNSQQVTLSPSGNYPVTLNPTSLIIGGKSSQQVNYCVNLPSGADGTNSFALNVMGDNGLLSTASFQLSSFGQSSFALNYSTCNSTTNTSGPSGLYSVSASASGYTSATQEIYVQQDYPNVASICLSPSSASITTPPQVEVFRNPTSTVISGRTVNLIADASSAAGISQLRIFYSVNNGQAQQASCNTDTCSVNIGPFNTGDYVTYYAQAIDSSSNYNSTTTNTQSFTVQSQSLFSEYSLPDISLSISPTGIIYPTTAIYLSANSSGSYNIQSTSIYYRVDQGIWHSTTCFANTCSFHLGSYPVGTTIYYYSTSTDTAAPANSVQTDVFTATVQPLSPSAVIGNLLLYVYDCNTLAPITTATLSVSGATSNFQTNANGFANIQSSTFSSAAALSYNNAQCPCIPLPVDSQSVVPISVYSSGPSSDYRATLDSGYTNLIANTVEPNLDGFGNGEWRTIYLNINTNGLSSGNYSLTFGLNAKQTGSQVYSSNICVYVPTISTAALQINPTQVSLSAGQTLPLTVLLTNNGNSAQNFLLFASTNQYFSLNLQSSQIYLQPGQSQLIPAVLTSYSNVPLGNYQITLNANDQNGGLIQSTQLPISIVLYQKSTSTPLSGISVSLLPSKPLSTSGASLVPVVIVNNNLYPINGLTLFFSNLPLGSVSKVSGPLGIPALGTVDSVIEVDDIGLTPDFYPAVLNAQSSTDTFQSNVYLPIGVSLSPLNVQVSQPLISYSFTNGTQIDLTFNVSNLELGTLNVTTFADSLPTDYSQSVIPVYQSILPNSTSEFVISLYSPNSPSEDFNTSIVVLSSSGRLARFPLALSPIEASSATGLFILSSIGNTGMIVILALLLIAGALFYLARNRLEDALVYHQSKKSK